MDRTEINTLELLAEVSQLFTLQDLQTVLRNVLNLIVKAVDAPRASLFLFRDGQVDWLYILDEGADVTSLQAEIMALILDKGLAGWVLRNQQIALIQDTKKDPRWHTVAGYSDNIRSALSIPISYGDHLLAVVTLGHPQTDHFSASQQQLLTIIANQAALAIHNIQLYNRVQAQQHQLEIVLQSIPDILLILDDAGQILMLNDAALPLLGQDQQADALHHNLLEIPLPDDTLAPLKAVIRGDSTSQAYESRSRHLGKDLSITISIWRNAQQNTSGYIVIAHDVTTLHDLSRFKDEMLHLASHDLRSPLALIVGYADMISLDTPDPQSPVHDYVEIIQNSTTRMGGLLEDLLRVEQIRRSPLELHEQVDPIKLVKIVLVNMRYTAESKNLRVESHIKAGKKASIHADPVLIRQAMENIVGNAIKYTPENGCIIVTAYTEKGRFYFQVDDTGIGIEAKNLPYIFEMFYRVDPAGENGRPGGTGLGLSLVKDVVERHKGQVWVKSEFGKGSQFGFWLPLQD